jgi:hypothetical protein
MWTFMFWNLPIHNIMLFYTFFNHLESLPAHSTRMLYYEAIVRSHSHDSSFMHSDVSPFYSYTVVAETHFVIVTFPLVSLFMPWWGGLEPKLLEMGGIGLRCGLQQRRYSLYNCEFHLTFFGFGRPISSGAHIVVCFSTLPLLIVDPLLLCLRSRPYPYQGCLTLVATYTWTGPDGPAIREHGPLE